MTKKLIVAAIIFGIASLTGFLPLKSTGTGPPFFAIEFSGIEFSGVREAAANAVIEENDRVVIPGTVTPKARPEFDLGPTDPTLPMKRMILLLKIAPEKQADLDRLLAEQQDPSSPNFHRWLTPEEFNKRFGRSPEEIATVKGWLITHGFTIDETPSSTSENSTAEHSSPENSSPESGTWINFSGTAANVESAFHAEMHDYQVEGLLHHANSADPSIPRALADLVAGPVSLHNFYHKAMHTPPRHLFDVKRFDAKEFGVESLGAEGPQAKPHHGLTAAHNLSPGDFTVIYNVNNVYNLGYDGSGVTIAIVGRTHPDTNKWNTFRSLFSLPYNPPVVTVNGVDPGDLGANEDPEADLDVEWSGAVARGATINFVTSQSTAVSDGVDLSAQYIVDNNLAHIISDCFGTCEANLTSTLSAFYYTLWQKAASLGITVLVVTGDSGAYDCTDSSGNPAGDPSVNGLASTPFNTAVGGTKLSDTSSNWSTGSSTYAVSALGYIPEVAWNEWNALYQFTPWASGGGFSTLYAKPAWQVCPGVPADGRRDVPDVSLNADTGVGYKVYTCANTTGTSCSSNSLSIIGGTSAASPSLAGIMALIVQGTGGKRLGNVNSDFYQLGKAQYSGASGASQVFHDIVSGDNGFGSTLPGYPCTAAYDLVTGLGSVDATNLLLAFQQGGSLTVTIAPPEAASAGAKWRVDNGPLKVSGATVSGLSVGSHTIKFTSVASWITPAGQKVTISLGPAKTVSATYLVAPPKVTSFEINGGASATATRAVTLNNTATGSPTYYKASESPTFTGAAWQPYSTAPSFTLSAANGTKTVYFRVKNTGGASAVKSDSIVLAQLPVVTSFHINGGAAATTNRTVTLNNTATIKPTHYMASEDPGFTGAVWLRYSTAPKFTLSAGSGTKTVYFLVKNGAGPSQPAVSASIQLN